MQTTHRIEMTDAYLAQVQRLTISQNTLLRLTYQKHWVMGLGVVVAVAFTGFLYAQQLLSWPMGIPWCGIIALMLLGFVLRPRALARARKRNSLRGSIVTCSLNESGLDTATPVSTSHLDWAAFAGVVTYPAGILFRLKSRGYLWLPDAALAEGMPSDVRELASAHIKEPTAAK